MHAVYYILYSVLVYWQYYSMSFNGHSSIVLKSLVIFNLNEQSVIILLELFHNRPKNIKEAIQTDYSCASDISTVYRRVCPLKGTFLPIARSNSIRTADERTHRTAQIVRKKTNSFVF